VGEVEWPDPPFDRHAITLDVEVVHPVSGALLPGTTVHACAGSDERCAEPLGEATTDGTGTARLVLERRATLVAGFFGYLEARGPGILDTLMYLYPPVVNSSRWLRYAATRDYIEPNLRQLGLAIDGVHGHIGINLRACTGGGTGACVSVSDPGAVVYYLVEGGVVDRSRTRTGATSLVGVSNVMPGLVTIQARRAPVDGPCTADLELVSEVTVWVRADTATFMDLPPTPPRR